MLNKDQFLLQEAYQTVLDTGNKSTSNDESVKNTSRMEEAVDPNSYSNAVMHGLAIGSVYFIANVWPKIKEFFIPKEEVHVKNILKNEKMRGIIDTYLKNKTPETRKHLKNALLTHAEFALNPLDKQGQRANKNEMVEKIIDRLGSISSNKL